MTQTWKMSDEEIRIMFKQCKCPIHQVRIIADLNVKSVHETKEKLMSLGFKKEDMSRLRADSDSVRKPVQGEWTEEQCEILHSLRRKGMTCKEIAEAMGRSEKAVWHRINVLEKSNYKEARE